MSHPTPKATEPREALSAHGQNEVSRAVQNASRLFSSLLVTVSVAFAVRFWLPRQLGPETFGILHFAQEFTSVACALATLGANTYIAKEISTRPGHASDFFGGLVVLRTLLLAAMAVPLGYSLLAMNKPSDQVLLVGLFALGQIFFLLNGNFEAFLNASASVRELARTSMISKILWGGAIVTGVSLGAGVWIVGAAFLATELGKALVLYQACRRHLGLRFRVDLGAGWHVLVASIPFYVNFVAHHIAGHIDTTMISAMINDQEVGWYGAAINVTFMIFLVLPVLTSVLLPMSARIAKESPAELNRVMAGTVRMILLVTMPMSILLALGARDVVTLVFSSEFEPTIGALQVLSPLVPITYLSVLFSAHLIQMGRGWAVAKISLVGLATNPLLNYLLLERGHRYFGDGGAGLTAACTTVCSEIIIVSLLYVTLRLSGVQLFERRTVDAVGRIAILASSLLLAHSFLARLGWLRPVAETLAYLGGAAALSVLPLAEIRGALRRKVL